MSNEILHMAIRQTEENIGIGNETYLDDSDGLIHCDKCREPMQYIMAVGDKRFKVPVMCRCRRTDYETEEARRKMREEIRLIQSLKGESLMDNKFYTANFATYDETRHNERQLKICKRYSDKFDAMIEKNQGLLLYGGVGTGKTYTAACIANALIDRSVTVVMTSFIKILQNVQSINDKDDEERIMVRLMRAKLLIIDDLGAERGTDYALEKVYNVIDSRYRSGKPMILTTNLTLSEMQETTDIRYARIYDRVFEVCYPLEFTGPSWRKREAGARKREMEKVFREA